MIKYFTCDGCGKKSEQHNTDEEALEEAAAAFGETPKDDWLRVCDDCYEALLPIIRNVYESEDKAKEIRIRMDKKIKELQKDTKKLEKGESQLLKADKKRDKVCDLGEKVMKGKK